MKKTNNSEMEKVLQIHEEGAAVQLAPGLTSTEMQALFFDSGALRESPYRLYRLDGDGARYYYRFEDGRAHFYPSVTTVLHRVMPTSPFLIEWMLNLGKEAAETTRDLAANYGTFMHAQIERLLISRRYDLDNVAVELAKYTEDNNLPAVFYTDSLKKIRKDILSFAQFALDYKVRPLAVEVSMCSSKGYAGCIDLPCVMADPKTGELFRAIVDFKSGKKGFWEEHELQLAMYRDMWNETYPDMQIERTFNWAPKDWRKEPTYTLKEQTNAASLQKLPHLLALASLEKDCADKSMLIVGGEIDLDAGTLADRFKISPLSEVVMDKSNDENHEDNG